MSISIKSKEGQDTLSPFIDRVVKDKSDINPIIKQSLEENLTEYVSVVLEKPQKDNFLLLIKDLFDSNETKKTVLLFESIIFTFCIIDKSPTNLTIATSHADSTIRITTFKDGEWNIKHTLGYINNYNDYDLYLNRDVIKQNLQNNGILSIIDLSNFLIEPPNSTTSPNLNISMDTTTSPNSTTSPNLNISMDTTTSTNSTTSTEILNKPFNFLAYNSSKNILCAFSSYQDDQQIIIDEDEHILAKKLIFWNNLNTEYPEASEYELMEYLYRNVYTAEGFLETWDNIDVMNIESCKNYFMVSITDNTLNTFILFINFLDSKNKFGSFNVVHREYININHETDQFCYMKYSILNNEEIILCKTFVGVFILKITNFEYNKIKQIFVPLDISRIYNNNKHLKFDICLDTDTHENLFFVVNEKVVVNKEKKRYIAIKLFKRNPSCIFSFNFCKNIYKYPLNHSIRYENIDIKTDISVSDNVFKRKKFFASLIYKNQNNIKGIIFSSFLDDLLNNKPPKIDKRPSYEIIPSPIVYLHKISTFLKTPNISDIESKQKSKRNLSETFEKISEEESKLKKQRKADGKSKKKSKKKSKRSVKKITRKSRRSIKKIIRKSSKK